MSTLERAPEDPFGSASKQKSWNDFGSVYWDLAAATSHPSEAETEGFLSGAAPGRRVLIVGATTVEVIQAAIERGAEVHVADFADKLLARLVARCGDAARVHLHDVNRPPGPELAASFDLVVADRLVNRFHRSQMPAVVANLMGFVRPGGQLRVSVRLGLYPLDRQLIQRGRELGTLDRFWNDETRTLDWSGVTSEIDDVAQPHGDIPASVVADWSRMRGVESRLELGDVAEIAREASALGADVHFATVLEMDVAPDSKTFVATCPHAR